MRSKCVECAQTLYVLVCLKNVYFLYAESQSRSVAASRYTHFIAELCIYVTVMHKIVKFQCHINKETYFDEICPIYLYLYKYENVCVCVCVCVCVFAFFSAILKPIGKPFGIFFLELGWF